MVKPFIVDVVPQVLSRLTTGVGSEIDVFRLESGNSRVMKWRYIKR